MKFSEAELRASEILLQACRQRKLRIVTAESCTGGLIAALLTEIPGSSDVVECGFITYSNAAKTRLLGVDAVLIAAHGAVSEPVACAMAEGVLAMGDMHMLSVAVTGIAGPGGGSAEKPVGTVHIAVAMAGVKTLHRQKLFTGSRSEVRMAAVREALRMMMEIV